MRVVHSNKDLPATRDELFAKAKEKEVAGEWEQAATFYEKLIKLNTLNEKPYDRLMIVYRKLKEPKKELNIIKEGIAVFENLYSRKHKTPDKKVIQLSKVLQKATGLVDKKGNSLYEAEPLGRWKRRKRVVERILEKL
jgi:hypothetical protein